MKWLNTPAFEVGITMVQIHPSQKMELWESWLIRGPVKAEIAGSSPVSSVHTSVADWDAPVSKTAPLCYVGSNPT